MTKLEPSSPLTVSVSPIEIVSVASPFVKLFPEARAMVTEVGVSETSLKTGSSLGNVPLAETASAFALISSCAEALGRAPRTQLALARYVESYERELLTRPEGFDPGAAAKLHAAALYRDVSDGETTTAAVMDQSTQSKPAGAYESCKDIAYNERGWIAQIVERVTPC